MKVKKDYLYDGAMADSADLVVLGAWYGTGNKGSLFDRITLYAYFFLHLIRYIFMIFRRYDVCIPHGLLRRRSWQLGNGDQSKKLNIVSLTPTKFKIRLDAGTHWSRRCNPGKPSG